MPAWVSDEQIWERAKAAAKKSGHEGNYAVVVSIYKKMGGKTGRSRKSLTETVADLLKGKARYQEGQVWQQKSGVWVTKKNGKIVKVKKGRKKGKKHDEAIQEHVNEAHETHKDSIKGAKPKKKPKKPKSPVIKTGKKKGEEHETYKQKLQEHQAIHETTDKRKGAGGEGAGSVQGNTGADSGEVSAGVYRSRGKEILVSRPELAQKPKQNYLEKNIAKALDAHQADGVNLAIENYESGEKGFFNADGTGAGKTRQIIALAAHYAAKENEPTLVVTKNESIIKNNFTDDAKAMGLSINYVKHPDEMKRGAVNICTYATLSKMARRVSVADERLGELAKHAWKYKTADEFIKATGAEQLSPEDAYKMIKHTKYAKKFVENYRKDNAAATGQMLKDFYDYSHGKAKNISFVWSGKAAKLQARMTGKSPEDHHVADAKTTSAVIFDEAHELKNLDSNQSRNGLAMMDVSKRVGLFTATPMDKPEHVHYICNAFNLDYDKVLRYCGYSPDKSGNMATTMPLEARMNALGNVFMNLTKSGKMIKREVSLRNMDLKAHLVPMAEKHQVLYNEAESFWDDKQAEAGYGPAAMNIAGQRVLAMRRLNEHFKIDHMVDKAIADLKKGHQAVLFFDNVGTKGQKMKLHKESRIEYDSSIELAKKAFEEKLKQHPDLAHIKIGEFHGSISGSQRRQHQKSFQAGQTHVFLTTPKSGGTGINLDDTTGNAPRSVHIATSPYSANEFLQMLGRTNRLTTKSRTYINMHVTDTASDDKNVATMINKCKTLGAAVSGDVEALKIPDKHEAVLPGMEGHDQVGDIWDSVERPFIPMNLDSFKKPMEKSLRSFMRSMVSWYKGRDMMKAIVQVGPQGGHYHISKTGNRVYHTEAGRAYHAEISAATHPDHVTNAIMKMDRSHRKGELHDRDMHQLMQHAGEHVKNLLSTKKQVEQKHREQRAEIVTKKRGTVEGARKERKAKVRKKLLGRIKAARKRTSLYKKRADQLKQAFQIYRGKHQEAVANHEKIKAEMGPLNEQAKKLKHYKETMKPDHPLYPKLQEAIHKHQAKVRDYVARHDASKASIADAHSKIQRIKELYQKGHGAMRSYTQQAKDDYKLLKKSFQEE